MNRLSVIEWLSLLRTIRQWLSKADDILDFPDIDNQEEVYAWSRIVLSLASESAKLTPTEIDDRVIAWLLNGPFATYESFGPYYEIMRAILSLVRSDASHQAIAEQVAANANLGAMSMLGSNPVGADPITIIAVIVQVIRIILELRRK